MSCFSGQESQHAEQKHSRPLSTKDPWPPHHTSSDCIFFIQMHGHPSFKHWASDNVTTMLTALTLESPEFMFSLNKMLRAVKLNTKVLLWIIGLGSRINPLISDAQFLLEPHNPSKHLEESMHAAVVYVVAAVVDVIVLEWWELEWRTFWSLASGVSFPAMSKRTDKAGR